VFSFVLRCQDERGSAKYTSDPVSRSISLNSANSDPLSSVMVRAAVPANGPSERFPDFSAIHCQAAYRVRLPRLPGAKGSLFPYRHVTCPPQYYPPVFAGEETDAHPKRADCPLAQVQSRPRPGGLSEIIVYSGFFRDFVCHVSELYLAI
jgi:hypothetical protein